MSNIDVVLTIAWHVGVIAILTFLSQTFTGLNIGLMSLDTAQLQVLIDVPNKDEAALQAAKYARRILPLRKQGNLLLCTILLGNTAVNSVMAVILGDIAGGFVGWLITTVIIVLLCEIIPQSVCTRHGLFLGAMGAPIIRLAMYLFFPITKPYAIVLDRLFPQRENLLDRSQLRALVEYQKAAQPNMLARGQAEMLKGALSFAERGVEEVMVPLEKAFKIQLDSVLDYELVATVVQRGFSRFPVIDPQTGQVAGILHCKDLLKQRFLHAPIQQAFDGSGAPQAGAERPEPAAPQTAGDLLAALRSMGQERQVYVCGRRTQLMSLLAEFKHRPHLAVVADTDEPGEAVGAGQHLGIVTLHNIFETILQAPVGGFAEQSGASPKRVLRQAGTVRLFHPRDLDAMAEEAKPLGENEAEAVLSFLMSADAVTFSPAFVSDQELLKLLRELKPVRLAKCSVLYRNDEEAAHGTLVLHGAVGVISGEEGFESTMGPLSCIGMRALKPLDMPVEVSTEATLEGELERLPIASSYVPDFTATVLTDSCLVLRIERKRYIEAHFCTLRGCN